MYLGRKYIIESGLWGVIFGNGFAFSIHPLFESTTGVVNIFLSIEFSSLTLLSVLISASIFSLLSCWLNNIEISIYRFAGERTPAKVPIICATANLIFRIIFGVFGVWLITMILVPNFAETLKLVYVPSPFSFYYWAGGGIVIMSLRVFHHGILRDESD